MIVQIYAATSVADAPTLAELGVDQIGFVAGDYGKVYGELTFAQARAITDALKGKAASSTLTMSTDRVKILRMAEAVQPDIVHVSSDTDAVGVRVMRDLHRQFPTEIALMKAIQVEGADSIDVARRFADVSDIFLLDTKIAGLPGVGATGVTHDWQVSRQIVAKVGSQAKIILAGGLVPENIAKAIRTVRPYGIDSNTGTNLAGDRVVKDMARVRAFVR